MIWCRTTPFAHCVPFVLFFVTRFNHAFLFQTILYEKKSSALYNLPWLRRTSERAHRRADRGRATAGRRASCPSVAVQSPNYARSKIQSVTLVAIANLNLCLAEAEKIFWVHNSPCRKLSELERGLLTYFTRLQGFVWQTVCVDTLLILAVRGTPPPPRVSDLFHSLGVSSPLSPSL